MPVNPNIPLSVQAPQIPGPLDVVQQIQRAQALRDEQAAVQEERAARTEARQATADELARKRAREAQIDEAYQSAVSVGDDGRITINKQALVAGLPPSAIPATLKELNLDEESVNRIQKTALELAQLKQKHVGSQLMTVRASGYDPTIFGVQVRGARDLGALDPALAESLLALDDPAQIQAAVDSYIQQAGLAEDVAPVETVDDQGRRVTRFVPKRAGTQYPAAPPTPTKKSYRPETMLVNGRPAPTVFDPETGRYSVGGVDVTDRVTPMPTREPAPDPLVEVMENGVAVWRPRAQASGQPSARGATGTRGVTSADAGRIAELDASRDDLATLNTALSTAGATGTLAASGAAMPKWVTDVTGWGTDAKKKQALIDRVKQVIGKTLEGGVLRKEDEVKYEKILPTIGDAPEIVTSKLQGLDTAIAQRRSTQLDALADAGYDVSRFQARPTRPALTAADGVDARRVTAPDGHTYVFATPADAAAFKQRAGIP